MKNTDEFYVGLGRKIQHARRHLGITQEQLAARLSLNRTSITNIESGKQRILVHTLIEIASIFGLSPAELFPSEKNPTKRLSVSELLRKGSTQNQRQFLRSVLEHTGGTENKHESSAKVHRKTG
jgi:transcriptional regulator with XRE-family HTH domain